MEGELQHVVGSNVRTIRLRRGLSQEQLADALGLHRTYIGGIERGERNLSLQVVERLAQNLNVPIQELLTSLDTGDNDSDVEPAVQRDALDRRESQ